MSRDAEISPELPAAWITRAEVKTDLGITGAAQDAKIDALLIPACTLVEAYCGTVVAQRTVTERLQLEDACSALTLRYAPAISLTSLEFDGIAQTVGDFRLAKSTAIVRHTLGTAFGAEGDWVVVYTAGFATVPAPIKQATLDLVRHLLSVSARDETLRRESVADVGETEYADTAVSLVTGANGAKVPPSVANALANYALQFSI